MQPIKIRHFQNRQYMHDDLGWHRITLTHLTHIHIHTHTHTRTHTYTNKYNQNIVKYVN